MAKIVAFLLLLSNLPCSARLGDSIKDSTTRYGAPISQVVKCDGCRELAFTKSGFILTEKFFKGVCVQVKIEKDSRQLDENEVKQLLIENAAGHSWDELPSLSADGKSYYYHRDDGALAAWRVDGALTISSAVPNPYDAELAKTAAGAADQASTKETQGL